MSLQVPGALGQAMAGEVVGALTRTKRNGPRVRDLSWESASSPLRITASTPSAITSISRSLKSRSSSISG